MTRGSQYMLIVVALVLATAMPATAQNKTSIHFSIAHVEDRYALNLPVIKEIFRILDFGYAGCSIELQVTRKGAPPPANANLKITVHYRVRRGPGKSSYTTEVNGSIARRSVPIYLKNKCSEVSNIKISDVKCFDGFKGQWAKLVCPYYFRFNEFAIPDYYDQDQ